MCCRGKRSCAGGQPQPGENHNTRVCTRFVRKEEFKVSKQVGQMSLCKVEESDRVKLAVARIKAVSRLFLLALAFRLRL